MSLDVHLEIDRAAALLSQQNPQCHLVISNRGPDPVELEGPGTGTGVPILRIVDPRTGVELFRKESGGSLNPHYWTLPARTSSDCDFPLLSISGSLLPGEYDISAIVPYARGAHRDESKPVRVKVAPVTPRGLDWSYVQGGWAAVAYGVSINATSDPPRILRYAFSIMRNGGVTDVQEVAPCDLRAAPVISCPPHKTVSHTHWIGWTDQKALAFIHFGEDLPPMKPVHWQPDAPDFFLVSPLTEDASDQADGPFPGAALVWLGDATRKISSFAALQLTPDGRVNVLGRCSAGSARPSWAESVFNSNRKKLLFFTLDEGDSSTLCTANWPEGPPAELKKLAGLPGHCQGGAVLLMPDDTVVGVNVTRGPVRAGLPVTFTKWRLDPEGKFFSAKPVSLPFGYQSTLLHCIPRVGPGGLAAVLLCDETGHWSLFDDSGEPKELPADVSKSALPRDIAYYNEGELTLFVGRMAQGFELMMSDGSPLPRR